MLKLADWLTCTRLHTIPIYHPLQAAEPVASITTQPQLRLCTNQAPDWYKVLAVNCCLPEGHGSIWHHHDYHHHSLASFSAHIPAQPVHNNISQQT